MKRLNTLPVKRQSVRMINTIVVILILTLFFGCVTGSSIITGTKRPATNPSKVKIYINPPTQYESIGIIEVKSAVGFSRQSAQDKAMNELKIRAAKVGANGVLLTNSGSQTVGTAGYYSDGVFYGGGASDEILAQGRAIYVTEE